MHKIKQTCLKSKLKINMKKNLKLIQIKKNKPKIYKKSQGFSFIEVMVVIIILGILSAIVGVQLFDAAEKAKVDATKTQIRGLETALDLYRLHNSRYPSSEQGLKSLLNKPEIGIIPKNWNGPYLRGKNLPLDGWGNHYKYISQNGKNFEIISLGADGIDGGRDLDTDINSSNLQ